MSGYYQKAFHQVRDILETSFLVDYLSTYRDKIDEWRCADKKKRIALRSRLHSEGARRAGRLYERQAKGDLRPVLQVASHASYAGISLITTGPDNMAQVGPFFDQKKLTVWLQEMALRLSPAASHLMPDTGGHDLKLLATRMHYLEVLHGWWSKYRGLNVATWPRDYEGPRSRRANRRA